MPKNIANYVGYSSAMDFENGNKGIWSWFNVIYYQYRSKWQSSPLPDLFTNGTLTTTSTYTSSTLIPGPSRPSAYVEVIAVGAGGGEQGGSIGGASGQGGFSLGRFIIPPSQNLAVAVGTRGDLGTPGPGLGGISYPPSIGSGGSGNSGPSYSGLYGGGGGGGFSGVFAVPPASPESPNINQANALLIAGGGGGNRYSGGIGGNGGGLTADTAPSPGSGGGGGGGTQVAGGAGGVNQPGSAGGSQGSALNGGNNGAPVDNGAYGGGGGGAGYYGGGGGGGSTTTSGANSAGGGGGSGYRNSSSPYAFTSPVNRLNIGMGDPSMGTGLTPAPPGGPSWVPGLGKDHPQISPYWAGPAPTRYGQGHVPGIVILNYYT